MKSWKIGAIAGLIAGIILGVITEIFANIRVLLGLSMQETGLIITNNLVVNIPLFGFWGIVLGIIYSKIYSIVPRKGILKGLIYGLFLYFIISIRIETFTLGYGLYLDAVGHIFAGFFMWLSYGLVLGFLYESLHEKYNIPKEKKKIITYDIKGGLHPGAIAALSCGISAGSLAVIGHMTGYWGVYTSGELVNTIEFWYAQFGHHIFIHLIWGTLYGLIFTKVYNLVPGEKVIKGLFYGLILFFITTFQIDTWVMVWLATRNIWDVVLNTITNDSAWVWTHIVYGLVLGYLYKPPK